MVSATSTSLSGSTSMATNELLYPSFRVSNMALSCRIIPDSLSALMRLITSSGLAFNTDASL